MAFENIMFEKDDSKAWITLNRPDSYNALNYSLTQELEQVISEVARDNSVKVAIITGSGKAFCAGGDLGFVSKSISGHLAILTRHFHQVIATIRHLPQPVIAAINGVAAGAGFSLAMACDLKIASKNAVFKQAYTSVGLTPDGGWTVFAPLYLGLSKAAELIFLDPVIDAYRARELGLVNEVTEESELISLASAWADKLVRGAPLAMARSKELINNFMMFTLESQLEKERLEIIQTGRTADAEEGVRAFLEKRPPFFKGQ